MQLDLSLDTTNPFARIHVSAIADCLMGPFCLSPLRTAVGIQCKDGVVLGTEKLILSKMLVKKSNRRIMNVDKHCGIVSVVVVAALPARHPIH